MNGQNLYSTSTLSEKPEGFFQIMNFEIYVSRKYVWCISLKHIPIESLSFMLPKLLFYDKPKIFHYHHNTIDNEKMIIISDECYHIIEPYITNNVYIIKYNIIQLMNTQECVNDIGIIAHISALFSNENIPILYLTTLENNFILFEQEYYTKSLNLLSRITNNIVTYD